VTANEGTNKHRGWSRIRPSEERWLSNPADVNVPKARERHLRDANPCLRLLDLSASCSLPAHWCDVDTLWICQAGAYAAAGEGDYRPGEIRLARAGMVCNGISVGESGCRLLLIGLGANAALHEAENVVPDTLSARLDGFETAWHRVSLNEVAWQEFDDPAGRPTQPVQILFDTDPYVLRTRFVPGFSAAEHWHDFDTLYLIDAGRMRFGDEGWYETGDIRWVSGGQSYGPEEPGADGVEFILVSSGGPVHLRWADLEPPPRGKLQV
jgi:anti-sigma factor ChrR (cupin superfamily)